MIRIYALIVLLLCIYIFLNSRWFRLLRKKWADSTLNPHKPGLTMFDVRRLLIKGERGLAIQVYRELFKTDEQEAVKAVDEIERSIQPKDFEF